MKGKNWEPFRLILFASKLQQFKSFSVTLGSLKLNFSPKNADEVCESETSNLYLSILLLVFISYA